MKDIVISGRKIAREIATFTSCFVAALLINVFSIIRFNTRWIELFTTLHITFATALLFFAFLRILRLIAVVFRQIFRRSA